MERVTALRGLKWLTVITSIGMFLVLLMGAVVTKTGFGDACGTDWPLCNGEFIPAFTIEVAVEYSHRIVSGLVGLLVVASFIGVWQASRRKDLRMYAFSALFFTVLQGILGAMAVMWSQSDLVMALHFGFSLIAFAATFLLAVGVVRIDRPADPSGWGEAHAFPGRLLRRFSASVWASLIGTYIVVYLGAYVRHTGSMAGCEGWPACNGRIWPDMSDSAAAIAYTHRLSALVLLILIVFMAVVGFRAYGRAAVIRNSCIAAVIAVVLQILSGALVIVSLDSKSAFLYSGLLHTVIVAALFAVLCYLAVLTLQWGIKRPAAS
jgi:cytochrome c oxidase assembly protein subunit 15